MPDCDANRERLELALEAAGMDLWENDLVSGEVPRRAVKVFAELGYSPEESAAYVDENYKLIHPEDVAQVAAAVEDHLQGRSAQYRSEFRLRAKEGRWVWYANYGKIIDRDSEIPGRRFIGVTFNIDERKKLEQRLAELLDLNERTVASSPVGILAYQGDSGQCVVANEAAAHIVGATREQLLSQNFRTIASWRERGLLGMAETVLRTGVSQRLGTHLHSSFGRDAWIDVTMTPFQSNGETCLLAMMEDISERKAALDELQRAKERAEEANRAKSSFLANMSHEIRTPMNTILGMAQLALNHETDPRQRDYLEKILHSGDHLLGIIDDLLDFSKIDADKLTMENVEFELTQLQRALVNQAEWKASAKGLRLSFALEPGMPAVVSGDPLRLNQVLINLVSNAIKFTEQGEIVVEGTKLHEDETSVLLCFEVNDSGIGLSEAQKRHLFLPFHQSDSSISRRYGGSGLGLAISRRLVEMMGGEIGVQSAPGEGSTFWFTVRLNKAGTAPFAHHAERAPVTAGAPRAALDALRGARILLAEDHSFNQQVATEFLEQGGAVVCVANNGEEALELLRRERFDCILMDVQMPVLDGLETTRAIRANRSLADIPVIALTANALGEDREHCLAAGMNGFIGKPFKIDEFYATLADFLTARFAED